MNNQDKEDYKWLIEHHKKHHEYDEACSKRLDIATRALQWYSEHASHYNIEQGEYVNNNVADKALADMEKIK